MRFTLLASLVGVLAGLAGGGRVRNLGRASFRALPLLGLGLAGLVTVSAAADGTVPHAFAVLVASLGLLAVFAVVNVVRFPGMWLVGLGLLANLAVVAVNGGMPYRPSALDAAGIERPASAETLPRSVRHHPIGPDDRMTVLGETIPLAPLREVLSPGDLAIGVGAASVLTNALVRARRRDTPRHARTRTRTGRRRAGARTVADPAVETAGAVVDVTRPEAVVDLTPASVAEGDADAGDGAGTAEPLPGEEFWRARAALLGEDDAAEPDAAPGELFWRTRELVDAPAPAPASAGGGGGPE